MSHQTQIMSPSEAMLSHGKLWPLFIKFALPSVISLLFMGIQSIIDALVLGNFAGANALASVSIALPCYSLIAAISLVVSVGCQTYMGISLGEGDRQDAINALRSAMVFVTIANVILSALLFIFATQIATLLGANDVLLSDSVGYIRALSPFFPVIALIFLCDYTLDTMGRTMYSMWVMVFAVISNIILDLLFVPYLGMGTVGAGLATGIAFTAALMFSLPQVLSRKSMLNPRLGHFSWRMIGRMCYNGSSEGVSELSAGVSILLFNITMMRYLGETGVAAFTALEYVLFICITIFLGVSNGIIPIISYNHGAGNTARKFSVLAMAAATNFAIGLLLFLALSLFGRNIINLFFSSGNEQVVSIAAHGAFIYAFAFLFNGLNILASSYFTAIGDARTSIIVSSLRGVVLVAPAIIILPRIMGIEGIWMAIPMAEAATFMVSVLLVTRSWRKARLLPTSGK